MSSTISPTRGTGEQAVDAVLSETETTFIHRVAFPHLDSVTDDRTLDKLTEALWNLCLWERQRTNSLDTKAAALTGLSSLAAAVVAASTLTGAVQPPLVLVVRCVAIALFICTVLLSLNAQRVVKFGGFHDSDVFEALAAHREPVGDVPKFADADPHRCFLRELSLQRWLIYRSHCDANDEKYQRLAVAQTSAAIAVVSLMGVVMVVLF